jgi:hypothetical protein
MLGGGGGSHQTRWQRQQAHARRPVLGVLGCMAERLKGEHPPQLSISISISVSISISISISVSTGCEASLHGDDASARNLKVYGICRIQRQAGAHSQHRWLQVRCWKKRSWWTWWLAQMPTGTCRA